ncbi:GGDEF domain-containing protein [Shewanella dokdonensis]|uniref:diguanylate cyclase n=1 Tax=Shewanella dokdonensis TaxID=712036 RepID=A0ABX8DGF7_9GAMM|nr:GGDEF domain-containing protein [Shewanella dokdonensis]MCL1074070.1 GGDEF domain-containing protein [Shewanella dokdonensis]QVK23808.1 GGDEF domain-containing protein [Shewanella dokdonensis]
MPMPQHNVYYAQSPELEDNNRRAILRIILWIIVVLGLILCGLNLHHGSVTVAWLEFGVVLFCSVFLYNLKRTSKLKLWIATLLMLVFVVVLYGMQIRALSAGSYYWVLVMPPLSLLLLGLHWGSWLSLLFGIGGMMQMLYTQSTQLPQFNLSLSNNALFSYLTIWAVSHVYEYKRSYVVQQLQKLASVDPLTGLYNRRQLTAVFEHCFTAHRQSGYPFGMLLLDVDHFKNINDVYGHDVGDQMLTHLACLMKANRRHDDWVFRVGGEEFCLLVAQSDKSQLRQMAERLRLDVEQHPGIYDGQQCPVTVSIGIATWPEDGSTFASLYQQADRRLYQAKNSGRNTVVA